MFLNWIGYFKFGSQYKNDLESLLLPFGTSKGLNQFPVDPTDLADLVCLSFYFVKDFNRLITFGLMFASGLITTSWGRIHYSLSTKLIVYFLWEDYFRRKKSDLLAKK